MGAGNHNLAFDRSRRITRKSDFERAFAGRCTAGDDLLVVYAIPNGLPHPRVGVIIGKRHGGAVQRNRLRRLLREAFRLEQHNLLAGFDLLLVPKVAPPASLDACRQSLVRLAKDAARRWHSRSQHRST